MKIKILNGNIVINKFSDVNMLKKCVCDLTKSNSIFKPVEHLLCVFNVSRSQIFFNYFAESKTTNR